MVIFSNLGNDINEEGNTCHSIRLFDAFAYKIFKNESDFNQESAAIKKALGIEDLKKRLAFQGIEELILHEEDFENKTDVPYNKSIKMQYLDSATWVRVRAYESAIRSHEELSIEVKKEIMDIMNVLIDNGYNPFETLIFVQKGTGIVKVADLTFKSEGSPEIEHYSLA